MEEEIKITNSKIISSCFIERHSSGLIEIIFDSKDHYFSVFRNAVNLITVESYTNNTEELITIKELSNIVPDHREYIEYYTSSKKQACILLVPWKLLDV